MIEFNEPYEVIIKNGRVYDGPGEYVGRPSLLGNPFEIGKDGTRDEVIVKYDHWFTKQLQSSVQLQEKMIQLSNQLEKERSLTLVCWCAPRNCHAEIIKKTLLELAYEKI
jgi:hypothetical protein